VQFLTANDNIPDFSLFFTTFAMFDQLNIGNLSSII
jgi:hypothetical protein